MDGQGYTFRRADSELASLVWSAVMAEDGEFTEAASEFWGLAFSLSAAGEPRATLIGPSLVPRRLTLIAGERAWGVEFPAHTFLRRRTKVSLVDVHETLETDGVWFVIDGVRFAVPTPDTMERLVDSLHSQGIIATDPAIRAALVGEDVNYSDRQLQRRFAVTSGLGRKQVEQRARARTAYALLSQGASPSEAAIGAGYSDQAHMTRAFKVLAGQTPARILSARITPFDSRPVAGPDSARPSHSEGV